jgi:uncharacterized protein (TIGR03437 family)
MSASRALLLVCLSSWPALCATFGTVVQHAQPIADFVVDDARKRLYIINTASNQIDVFSTTSNPPRLSTSVPTDSNCTPLSAALSRNGKFLYVACFSASSLDIIDVSSATFTTSQVSLAAPPQAVAVGFDEKVLISTSGTAAGQDILITYDPTTTALRAIPVVPTAPSTAQLPPPNGVMALASHSHLVATPDGKTIIGVHELANNTRTVYVYESASSTVLAARNVAGISPVLAVSPDGSRFVSGPLVFESATMLVLAQQSTINSPFLFPTSTTFTTFNTQTNQGGGAFSPDGSVLLTAYGIAPLGAARSNIGQLLVNSPSGMQIQLGIQLPEFLSGKMVFSGDGSTVYAISQSGLTVLPMATITQSPIAVPDSNVALLAFDQCGVTAAQNSATIPIRNVGAGRMTATATLAQGLIGGSTTNSPQVRTTTTSYGADLTAQFGTAASRGALGTVTPDSLVLTSPEAVNIPNNVRIYQNNRNTEARGSIIPVDTGSGSTGLTDMLADLSRQRLYIANPSLNRVEVFDTQQRQFLAPITAGQQPRSLAFGNDTNTLYVANSNAESISIVDLTQNIVIGSVKYPPIPFNATFAPITPLAIASTQRGPQVLMSDFTLWKIVGNALIPRTLNPNIFGATARAVSGPVQTMASSSDGNFLLLLAGNGSAFLYSAAVDDFVAGKQVVSSLTGYFGPIAVGPSGNYFLVDDQVLNSALTSSTGGAGSSRPVAAVSAVSSQAYVRFSMPPRASATTAPTDPGLLELVDPTNGRVLGSASTLEGPLTPAVNGQRANIAGRTMAVDATGSTAFILTTSGISIYSIGTAGTAAPPQLSGNAMVNIANLQAAVAPGGLVSILGKNLAASASAGVTPYPTILGGSCVTFNNSPLPLLSTSDGQINAQIPVTLAAGRYPLVVRSIANQAASGTANITVSKYAPAVFVDAQGPSIFHKNGDRVDKAHPGVRDEPLTIYATGLGVTTGGRVTTGVPAPSNPLAVTAKVNVFFGDPTRSDTGVIVDWSGLAPGMVGVYQINCRIPGTHESGDALPVTVRIGGVNSPVTGPNVPVVYVR